MSDNFFDYDVDMNDALNILDIDQMDGVMQVWRQEAHKKMYVQLRRICNMTIIG